MLAPTHSVFGIFLTLVILAVFGVQWSLHWSIIFFAALGAIFPDIDYPKSTIGKIFFPISSFLERRFGHRTITHSFIGWTIASIIFAFFVLFGIWIFEFIWDLGFGNWDLPLRWLAAFSIGFFSHLILDMFNKRGSQMFWPNSSRDVIPRNPKYRFETGAKCEAAIFFILLVLMFCAFPISKYGIGSSMRWLIATPESAIEEFKTLMTHTYVEFKGIMSETREPVEGKAEILDVNNKRLVILLPDVGPACRLARLPASGMASGGDVGHVFTLSDELSADIIASHVRTIKTNIPIKTQRLEFKDRTRSYLLSQIPDNALISGVVRLPADMQIDFSNISGGDIGRCLSQKGNDLILSFASKNQIKSLALNQSFALQIKKDRVELSKLLLQAEKIRHEIAFGHRTSDLGLRTSELTYLGRQLLQSTKDAQKQKVQLARLNSSLSEINLKIEELKIKMEARKLVFSGEVYVRR